MIISCTFARWGGPQGCPFQFLLNNILCINLFLYQDQAMLISHFVWKETCFWTDQLRTAMRTAWLVLQVAASIGFVWSNELQGKKEQEREAAAKASALACPIGLPGWPIGFSCHLSRWGPTSRRTLTTNDIWWKEMRKFTNTNWDLSNEKKYLHVVTFWQVIFGCVASMNDASW